MLSRVPAPLDARRFRVLTFDCYGTLIDWDGGIRHALEALASLKGCDFERLTREREEAELALIAEPYRPYGEILGQSLRVAAQRQGRTPEHGEVVSFVSTMGRWPAFPDSGS